MTPAREELSAKIKSLSSLVTSSSAGITGVSSNVQLAMVKALHAASTVLVSLRQNDNKKLEHDLDELEGSLSGVMALTNTAPFSTTSVDMYEEEYDELIRLIDNVRKEIKGD